MRISETFRPRYAIPAAMGFLALFGAVAALVMRSIPEDVLGHGGEPVPVRFSGLVTEVPAGDNLVLEDGKRVRLIGVDAPFPNRHGHAEAKGFTELHALGKAVRFETCAQKPRDRKGRILAFAWSGGTLINRALLERGLGELYADHKCLGSHRTEFWETALDAFRSGRGLLSVVRRKEIADTDAAKQMRRYRIVTGTVTHVNEMKKLTVIHLGGDFRLVAFSEARGRLARYLDRDDLIGTRVKVFGRITDYNGPQVILQDPVQILAWDDSVRG